MSPSYATTSTMECASYSMPVAMPLDYNETHNCYYGTSNSSYLDQSAMVSSPTMVQYPFETGYAQQYQTEEYQSTDYSMYGGIPTPESIKTGANDPSNRMVPTRQRKIIVKQLQPWVTSNQVLDLIRKKAGSDADKIQHIDLPLTDGQESNRGYALVTFQSEEVANKLIRRLNGYKYDGRELRVDYTKEGVSENETVRSRTSGHKERREDREKKEKKDSPRGGLLVTKKIDLTNQASSLLMVLRRLRKSRRRRRSRVSDTRVPEFLDCATEIPYQEGYTGSETTVSHVLGKGDLRTFVNSFSFTNSPMARAAHWLIRIHGGRTVVTACIYLGTQLVDVYMSSRPLLGDTI